MLWITGKGEEMIWGNWSYSNYDSDAGSWI